jgi:DNA-binding CsgD family transcriptional regulator/PAS domain-containing protein
LVETRVERAAELLDVAQHFFNAATAPADWVPGLDAIVDLLRADHAMLVVHEAASGQAIVTTSARMDEADFERFLAPATAHRMEPFRQAIPSGTVVTWSQLISDRDFEGTEFYNEVVRPVNGFYALATRHELPSISSFMAVCRSRRAGDFSPNDAMRLQTLLPPLATSLQLHQRLQVTEDRSAALATALDRLDCGLILTDATARPMFMNAAAGRIVAQADGLMIEAAPLVAATPMATIRLREAIAAAGAVTAIEARHLRLERLSGRFPLHLTVLPVSRLGALTPGACAPRVAIFIKELDAPVAVNQPAVIEAFRLTPRECEIATLLAGGRDLDEIAAEIGAARSTVRSHLIHIFEKTGAHSQAALVALLCRFVEPQR